MFLGVCNRSHKYCIYYAAWRGRAESAPTVSKRHAAEGDARRGPWAAGSDVSPRRSRCGWGPRQAAAPPLPHRLACVWVPPGSTRSVSTEAARSHLASFPALSAKPIVRRRRARSATAPLLRRRCFAGSRALLAGSGILLAGSGRHRCGGREGREQPSLRAAPPPPQVPEEGREEAGRVEAAGAVSARGRSGSAPERVCRLRLRAPRRRASLGPCSSPRAAPESG